VLQKGYTYRNIKDDFTYRVVDYIFYKGTKEHGFTFDVNGQIKKQIIKDSNFEIFLLDFQDISIKKPKTIMEHLKETQGILLETLKDVKNKTINVDVANSVAKVAQTLINLEKVVLTKKSNDTK